MGVTKWVQIKNSDTELHTFRDAEIALKTELEARLPLLQEIRALSDDTRTNVAAGGIPGFIPAFSDLVELDDYLDDAIDQHLDQLDLFDTDHENRTENLSVRDGAWYLPEALETPLPDDDGTNVVANAIDNDGSGPNSPLNSTYWMSTVSGTRVLTVRLRGYRKRVDGVRFRTNSGDKRSQLQNVTIKAAAALVNLDTNVVATGLNLDDSASWFEHDFVKARCRYLRFEIPSSLHTDPDVIRIRTVQVRVGIILY